uniref:Uncharacterized protein n=1 Tax=Sphingobacterium sp. (strain 21) TaxID=743722 RepID=F4C9X6_SPHS2
MSFLNVSKYNQILFLERLGFGVSDVLIYSRRSKGVVRMTLDIYRKITCGQFELLSLQLLRVLMDMEVLVTPEEDSQKLRRRKAIYLKLDNVSTTIIHRKLPNKVLLDMCRAKKIIS